jgi:hypothetical protein
LVLLEQTPEFGVLSEELEDLLATEIRKVLRHDGVEPTPGEPGCPTLLGPLTTRRVLRSGRRMEETTTRAVASRLGKTHHQDLTEKDS